MHKKLITLFIVTLFFIGCSSAIKLQYQGTPGEIRRYQMNTDLDQTMEMMGNEMNFTTQVINFISEKINQVDKAGTISVIMTFDSVSFSSTNPQIKAAEDKIKEMMGNFKGKEITSKISKRGEILESSSPDSLIPDQMRQIFSSEQTFSALYPEFSEKPVKIGDNWEIEKTTPINARGFEMKIKTKNKYTLLGKEEQGQQTFLKIKFDGSVQFDGKGEQMGMQLIMEGDGDTKGEFLYHDRKGIYYGGTSETNMDLTIAMTGAQNMTIPMTQFIKMKITKLN